MPPLDRTGVARIMVGRFRHATFSEARQAAGLARVPFVCRGFGWKDGSEDIERFRRVLFDGEIAVASSMLPRSAFSDAITLVGPAGFVDAARKAGVADAERRLGLLRRAQRVTRPRRFVEKAVSENAAPRLPRVFCSGVDRVQVAQGLDRNKTGAGPQRSSLRRIPGRVELMGEASRAPFRKPQKSPLFPAGNPC